MLAGRRRTEQVAPSNALVASSVAYAGMGRVDNVYRPAEAWQKDAWDFYDITPELRFAATWIANGCSRCVLKPGHVADNNEVMLSDDPKVAEALRALFGNSDGQSQMLYYFGLHLSVAGECYLVGRKVPRGMRAPDGRLWEVVGVREINTGPTGWTIQSSIDNTVVRLGPSDTVIRIWRGHPAYRYQADSPVRALLPILSEIKFLTLHVYAQTISRLAGAGLMVLPKSVEFPGMDKLANQAEGIQKLLGQVMAKAIANPGDPSSLVPILLRVNDESVDKVREPLHFWSPFDANASQARKEAIIRFSTGFDLPPEVISGMSANLSASGGRGTGLSHWGQWQIEESAIKMHIEPLLDVITNGLVMSYVRPVTDEATAAIVVDSTPLKLQPDRSKDAAEAYDRGELSGEGLRYYKGLSDDYQPSDDDKKYAILRKMATGSASPEMVAEAARLLGVDITPPAVNIPAPATRPNPSLIGHPVRSKPDRAASLTLAAEALVLRALERAGNRLRNQGIQPPDTPAHEVYQYANINGNAPRLLDDAWCHVHTIADGLCDTASLTSALNAYTESLLVQKAPYSRDGLVKYLALVK